MLHRLNGTTTALCTIFLFPLLSIASDTQHCYLRDANSPAAGTAYLLCEQGLVYSTADNGATWASHDTGATVTLHSIAFTDTNHGFVTGDEGTILATADGGKTWQPRTSGTKENLLGIYAVGNLLWASGFDGIMLHSTDGGATWTKQTSGTTMALEGLYFLDADHGWAVGWSGTILRTVDGGKTWKLINTDAASWSLASVRFFDANNGYAVGFSGQLVGSKDGGLTWTALKSGTQSWLTSVAMDRNKRIWVAADDHVLSSTDGAAWQSDAIEANYFIAKIFPVGDSLWALAELGLLRETSDGKQFKPDTSFVPAGSRIGNSLDDTGTTAGTTNDKSR